MIAVILAGGLGTRLRPFTNVIPKPLLPIGEKALLEIQIEYLKKHGFNTIYLCTYYKSEYIRNFFGNGTRYGVHLNIVKEEIPLGTVGPVKMIEKDIGAPFALLNGDILTDFDISSMYRFACSANSWLTIGTKDIITKSQFGKISFMGDYVTAIEEKPDVKTTILAGICILKPEVLQLIPAKQYYGMDSLINKMIAEGKAITHYDINDDWLDIGQVKDYEKAQEIYKEKFQ